MSEADNLEDDDAWEIDSFEQERAREDIVEGVDRRETITLPLGDLEHHTRAVLSRLHVDNVESPSLFQRDSHLLRIRKDRDRVRPERLDKNGLRAYLLRRYTFEKELPEGADNDTKYLPEPSRKLRQNVLSQSRWSLPVLESVARNPVYGGDWSLRLDDGYHPGAKVYVHTGDLDVPMPTDPSEQELQKARSLILDDMLVDFPFSEDGHDDGVSASRAHAVALALLPLLRPAIDSTTPLHLVSAPVHGTGKGKLVQAIANVIVGQNIPEEPGAEDDAEWRKTITAKLKSSPTFIFLDNLNQKLDSAPLAMALTSRYWQDRELQVSDQVRLRNDAVWVATANNPRLSGELSRRVALIRMNPHTERPWKRDDFKHDPLLEWVCDHRRELMWALLVLVEYWISCGCPDGEERLGSYKMWSSVLGGILECAGIGGFLENSDDLHEQVNDEVEEWKALVEFWWGDAQQNPDKSISGGSTTFYSTSELRNLCSSHDLLLEVLGSGRQRSQTTRLGKAMTKRDGRIFSGKQIEKSKSRGRSVYRLVEVNDKEGG